MLDNYAVAAYVPVARVKCPEVVVYNVLDVLRLAVAVAAAVVVIVFVVLQPLSKDAFQRKSKKREIIVKIYGLLFSEGEGEQNQIGVGADSSLE